MFRPRKKQLKKEQTARIKNTDAVTRFIKSNEARLKRSARKYSLCADDAEDAWQRTLEIFITRAPATNESALLAWMHTVVKHEAFAVKKRRLRLLGDTKEEFNESELICDRTGLDERIQHRERVIRADAALQLLKRSEAECLILKAQGLSYEEVAEATGFSWSKINRSICEGRKSFLHIFRSIVEGSDCDNYRCNIEALVKDGVRPTPVVLAHLRGCDTCRASLRELRRLQTT